MDAEQARTEIERALTLLDGQAIDNAVLRGPSLEEADATRVELTRDLAEQVAEDVAAHAASLMDRHLVAYDPSYQTSASQALVERLEAVPELARVDRQIRSRDLPDDRGEQPLTAMAHAVGASARGIVAYRFKGPGIATRRRRGLSLLVPRDGLYEPMEQEVLYYEPRFDALTCGGFVLFTAVSVIQRQLKAEDKARSLARRTLETVTSAVRISGVEELGQAVEDDPTLRAKMAAVARVVREDPEYAQALTTERLVSFAEENPEYGIAVDRVDGQPALAFDPSPQGRHRIPRLLADDYLQSRLTGRHYEAGSKSRVTPEGD